MNTKNLNKNAQHFQEHLKAIQTIHKLGLTSENFATKRKLNSYYDPMKQRKTIARPFINNRKIKS